jgi:hypothetical protein
MATAYIMDVGVLAPRVWVRTDHNLDTSATMLNQEVHFDHEIHFDHGLQTELEPPVT